MPAEIDTGGHRVLHCDSRADCPTATSIHVSELNESRRRAPKARRQKARNCVRKAEPLARRRGNPSSGPSESSPTRVPRIDDKEETILGERDFLAKSRVLAQPSHRQQGGSGGGDEDGTGLSGACRASRESPCAIEGVTKDERFPATWNPRKNAVDEIGRAESRLHDETARYRTLAIVDTNGSSIAKRRSLRDRSRTRPRQSFYEGKTLSTEPTDRLRRTPTARGNSLLSSHRSRARAKEETCEDSSKDVNGGFFKFDDTRTDGNRRTDSSSGRRDERPKNERNKIRQDPANGKRIRRACRVYSFLQLAFLLLLVVFGRYGLLGSSSVLRVNARPIANGLSVLGIGIIGAVNARSIDPIADAGIRAERSANLSYMTGRYRGKIQMYIKNRYLQILPDGTVNGSNNHTSDYTIFQRTSVGSHGQLTIQSMATCLFLCMDVCGELYGSLNCTAECVFNETLEQHNYNTYSSVYWSTANKTLYLGLDRYGRPKRIRAKGHNLGRLSANARVLTQVAPPDRVENLQRRILGAQHKVRHWYHHRQISDDVPPNCPKVSPQDKDGRDRFRCRKRKKRKKRKRRCRPDERPGPQCQGAEELVMESVTDLAEASSEMVSAVTTTPESKRSCEGAASEEACRRQALSVPAKKRKSRKDDDVDDGGRNLTLGKNKAPTSNAKKPNVSVADNQSKKPDLTDGKKKKKRTTPQPTSRGSTMASPSRKRYGPGTTSWSRASLSLTAPGSEEQRASTAALSSSPSLLGASTALFSITRPSSARSDQKRLPLSSRNHIVRPIGSRRVGKSSRGNAALPGRSKSTSSRGKIAFLPSTTKVPDDICAYITTPLPQFSPVSPSSSLSWQESEDSSLSYSSLVDEESSTIVTSELAIVTVEPSTLAASDEILAEVTTLKLDEKNSEDSDMVDMIPQTTTTFPLERLAM